MGRAEGVAVSQVKTAGSRRRGSLSLIPGGAEPPCWTAPTLERLTRALDLRPTGFGRYEVTAAEARWPAFPAALLVAAAVVAAERSLPGLSVGHVCCSFGSFGPPPRADRPVEVALSEVHAGESCATGRLTFRQRSAVHGEATVMLRSRARPVRAGLAATPPAASPASAPQRPAAGPSAARRPAAAIAEWELRDAAAAGGSRPAAEFPMWSRLPGAPLDGTLQRALLAYLSELQPVNALRGIRYPPQPGEAGPSATVLSHAITYGAQFDLKDWLLATVSSAEPSEGYVHALAAFRTRQGETVATVSQAVAVAERARAAFPCPVRRVPAAIRYGSQ